jgi:hypothetical protein
MNAPCGKDDVLRSRGDRKSKDALSWDEFERRLDATLTGLPRGCLLILALRGSNRFVQFATRANGGFRAETTSNQFLSPAEKMTDADIAALTHLGWHAPDALPTRSEPNYFVLFSGEVPKPAIAGFAVRTLRDVLRVPRPSSLRYTAAHLSGEELVLPDLRLAAER